MNLGLRQKDIAEKVYICESAYNLYETGKRRMRVDMLESVCNVVGLSVVTMPVQKKQENQKKECTETSECAFILKKLKYIDDHLTREVLLDQVIEECAELIQACSKLKRASCNNNYTPWTISKAKESIIEELADVKTAGEVLAYHLSDDDSAKAKIEKISKEKLMRWMKRLKENEQSKER